MAFIASIKATVTVAYSDEVSLSVRVLFFKIKILPAKEKRGKRRMSEKKAAKIRDSLRKKQQKKALAKKEKEQAKETKEKKSISETISGVKMITDIVLAVIKKFFGHLQIKMTRIKMIVATEDAATTAIAYGAITQSLNILLPALESVKNFKKLKKTEIDIRADFLADSPTFDVEISFAIRVWHLFDVAFAALGKFIKRKLASDANSTEDTASDQNTESKTAKHKLNF